MSENLSYKPRFKVGRLVMHDAVGLCKVKASRYIGDHPGDTWCMVYDLWHRGFDVPSCPEPTLKDPELCDMLLYSDPETKGLKIGYNRAWPLLFALNLSLAGIIYLTWAAFRPDFTVWHGIALAACVGVWVIAGVGTYRNYKGKTF